MQTFETLKQNFIYFSIVLLFFGLSSFYAVRSRSYNRKLIKVNNELILQKQKVKNYNERTRLKLFMNSEEIEPVFLLDPNNDSISIQELVKTPKLVFRFTEQFCRPCIEQALESLKLLGESIGYNNILIISDVKTSSLLKIFIKVNDVFSPCYSYSKQFNFEIEGESGSDRIPYYMVLDQYLHVSFPFFAEENDELNSIYLDRIKRLFYPKQ